MTNKKRHTCIICKSKRYEINMNNVFGNSWACVKPRYYFSDSTCFYHGDIKLFIKIIEDVKKLKILKLSYLDLSSCHSRTYNASSSKNND